jgi:peptide/nickel transport system ATP-binding protein/oligopeptide transport system ATP-binding protein
VGESGCGKTTLGRTILRLEKPTFGTVGVGGNDITSLSQSSIRPLRAHMQMIFQDPVSSLSPRKTVAQLLLEPYKIHTIQVDMSHRVEELLEMVGLSSEQADKYPHQLSGGQARRVGIARALALNPSLLIADEPTSGLDVSVAAGILNLLKDLRERLGLTYILITHNLNIISFIADRVAVMYLGKLVEVGKTSTLFTEPKHPYTEALMSAVALPDPELRQKRKRIRLEGEIPSPRNPPSGCPFHPRCRYCREDCITVVPSLRGNADGTHLVACHFPAQLEASRQAE